jgi:hypothetical protein
MGLTGPGSACLGESSAYSTEVPVACSCQWSVDGIIQPDTTSTVIIQWTQTGYHIVSVTFICDGGQVSEPESMSTYVGTAPPAPIQGPSYTCINELQAYTTAIGPGEICHWLVDGVLQTTTSTTLSYTFTGAGPHTIEVSAEGPCGTGDPVTKNVAAQDYPDVFLGNDTILQIGQTITLDAGNPGSAYLWSTGATTQTLLVTVTGTYSVVVTNACGSDTDEIEVTVLVHIRELENGQPPVTVSGRQVKMSGLPFGAEKIELFDVMGRRLFCGLPGDEIVVQNSGIFIYKITSSKTTVSGKIFIP